jgi:hypothetical protein
MIVAIDADAGSGGTNVDGYVRIIVSALLARDGAVERIVVMSNVENHARFEMLRDERCDVAMVRRPLFEGHTVSDWPALLSRQPRAGAELLGGHLQEKLRIIRELGVDVVHFPADAAEAVNLDLPTVVSLHDAAQAECPPSAALAHAVILTSDEARERLCAACAVSRDKAFVAPWPGGAVSLNGAGVADDVGYDSFAAAICEAYEHALASFELRDAA